MLIEKKRLDWARRRRRNSPVPRSFSPTYVNRCGRSMTNSGLRTIYFKYNRSIHWPICYGHSGGDANGVRARAPPCFPYVERGETDARCNPYNVTPKRARNSNIMDSVSPYRNTRAPYISPSLNAVVLSISALAADSTRWWTRWQNISCSLTLVSRARPRFHQTKGFRILNQPENIILRYIRFELSIITAVQSF